jgi:hypothetical protein
MTLSGIAQTYDPGMEMFMLSTKFIGPTELDERRGCTSNAPERPTIAKGTPAPKSPSPPPATPAPKPIDDLRSTIQVTKDFDVEQVRLHQQWELEQQQQSAMLQQPWEFEEQQRMLAKQPRLAG